ncbi:MAG: DASH family cryptochrome [Burkholderiales bacterium]|nr:DASH family cryptochrome [Burkholderiales bacterium]
MSTVLFWFRNDLRLHDQPALHAACAGEPRYLLPVVCLPGPDEITPWGFARMGPHRRAWLADALHDLERQLARLNCPLLICAGPPATTLPQLARAVGASAVACEEIAAPQEQAEVAALRAAGLTVRTVWQSTLLDPASLPWPVQALPASFTPFRQAVERLEFAPPAPLPPPTALPPWPPGFAPPASLRVAAPAGAARPADARASFPYGHPGWHGGETAGLAHLARYLARGLPVTYKQTRNALCGVDFSSKWSPWLATGALSVRRIVAELRRFEAAHGASDGSYWLWFELLWRDYFRFVHLQHGAKLYRERGLSAAPRRPKNHPHDARALERWRRASTGAPLIDAAMRELTATGYMSNRLRQVSASYLVHELGGDWRAGAAWFESQLLDYDVYSNQGNWLYIAGRGNDPRGGRRFNLDKQAAEHDPQGTYRQRWSAP